MADNTENTNNNLQSNNNTMDNHSDENSSPLENQTSPRDQDNEIKISEPVSDVVDAVSQQIKTTLTALQAEKNTTSQDSNLADQNDDIVREGNLIDTNSINTSSGPQPCESPTTNQSQSQINTITTNNSQQKLRTRKHIMISYKHGTATSVCRAIRDRLTTIGYDVWFDEEDFTHGRIFRALGDAIDNAYVVLLCVDAEYSKSDYCLDEAIYARYTKHHIIPCVMEKDFQARGVLGIILSDWKNIEFFDDNKFEENFNKLTRQIDAIKANSDMTITPVDNKNIRFSAILIEHMLTIRKLFDRRRNRNEAELWIFIRKLIQEFSPETWQSFENDLNNDVSDGQPQEEDNDLMLQHLFMNTESLLGKLRENHARIEQHFIDQGERLASIQHFQQEQMHMQPDSDEHSISIVHIQDTNRQSEEQSDPIVERLQQEIKELKELIVNQQEHHARDMDAMRQSINQTSETLPNTTTTQQQPISHFNFGSLTNVLQTAVLMCTLLVLFKTYKHSS